MRTQCVPGMHIVRVNSWDKYICIPIFIEKIIAQVGLSTGLKVMQLKVAELQKTVLLPIGSCKISESELDVFCLPLQIFPHPSPCFPVLLGLPSWVWAVEFSWREEKRKKWGWGIYFLPAGTMSQYLDESQKAMSGSPSTQHSLCRDCSNCSPPCLFRFYSSNSFGVQNYPLPNLRPTLSCQDPDKSLSESNRNKL